MTPGLNADLRLIGFWQTGRPPALLQATEPSLPCHFQPLSPPSGLTTRQCPPMML